MLASLLLLSLGEFGQAFSRSASNASNSSTVVVVPDQYTYSLPNGFEGNSNYTFVNGTTTSDAEINQILKDATIAPVISYDESFYTNISGSNPETKLIQQRPTGQDFAYEMGVWVPERNSVWFTSAVSGEQIPPALYELNLSTNAINEVQTDPPVTNPNGGYYFKGKVYIATYPNNESYSGGVVAVDVTTSQLQLSAVTNSYFGLRYNGIDDIAWASRNGRDYMYFTDLNFAYQAYSNLPPLQLPVGVWRWDPQERVVLPVISRNEVNPNGVRVSPDMKTLYVTDSTATFAGPAPYTSASGPGDLSWYGPYVYAYDLDDRMLPVNRRLFSLARQGIADGIHCDDDGNVWTGEYEGVVVRNPGGKVIGVFNSQYFEADKNAGTQKPVANFALANDTLIFLAGTRLWTVKLARTVVSSNSPIVN